MRETSIEIKKERNKLQRPSGVALARSVRESVHATTGRQVPRKAGGEATQSPSWSTALRCSAGTAQAALIDSGSSIGIARTLLILAAFSFVFFCFCFSLFLFHSFFLYETKNRQAIKVNQRIGRFRSIVGTHTHTHRQGPRECVPIDCRGQGFQASKLWIFEVGLQVLLIDLWRRAWNEVGYTHCLLAPWGS